MAGIVAAAAHVPRRRMPRAALAAAHGWAAPPGGPPAGARSIAAWDEDAVTLAVAAARALGPAPAPESLTLASTSLPFADRSNAGIVAAALDLGDHVEALDATGSLRAGSAALARALKAARPGERALLCAADVRPARPGSAAESAIGDAGVAMLVGSDDVLAEFLGHAVVAADFVDHYRTPGGDADYALEERWVRDEAVARLTPVAVQRVLGPHGLAPSEIAQVAWSFPSPALARAAAKAAGLPAGADELARHIGHAGAAQPLLALVEALEAASPGDHVLLLAFGQGVEALLLRATDRIAALRPTVAPALANGVEDGNYTRFLVQRGLLPFEWGIRAERDNRTAHSAAWRRARDLLAFVGGRCSRCGTVQFPRTDACVNPNCRALEPQEPYPLARSHGTIASFTRDWQAHHPDPPLIYGNIRFAEGGNALMEVADSADAALAVGQRVEFAFRIKDRDERRDFTRYFWKAVPVDMTMGRDG
jgi:hydroxymethylglutaryl-CoA synthase